MNPAKSISVTSTAFAADQPIPKKYTGDGDDVSPPLAWSEGPAGTKEWALICDDPDAPTDEPWVHWVLYKVLAATRSLPEGIKPVASPPQPPGALQGKNSWTSGSTIGYRGPAPPKGHGTHHYHFRLYALDAELPLKPELTKDALLKAIDGHVLATGELVGTYSRR
jgi:Raf kinase inhibitor-like YbhB/YbcL family protein